MPLTYRRPGVYIEESLLVNPSDVAGTVTAACFVGVTQKGPILEPQLVESWSDFVALYGGFGYINVPDDPPGTALPTALSYLPYAVYSFFQNGGRICWVIRAAPSETGKRGVRASKVVNTDITPAPPDLSCFTVEARSVGQWGNTVKYGLVWQNVPGTGGAVFALQVLLTNTEGADEVVETFTGLSMKGDLPGTRRADTVINDPYAGSRYILITDVNDANQQPAVTPSPVALTGGTDPALPDAGDLQSAAQLVTKIEGPVMINISGYLSDANKAESAQAASVWVGATLPSTSFSDRQDIFIINDDTAPRSPGQSSSSYKDLISGSSDLGANLGDSYSASYGPWIIIPNPARVGTTMTIPPGGAVMGMTARIDATIGVFRAPAGVIAGLSNAVGVQTKFTDTELGDLNSQNINIIRSVVGAGICVMGGRTRKTYGADRYVSARRTLIYIKEVMRRSTQFAVFENNDQRLWSALRMSAERILRPLWEAGGLRGANSAQAYFIRCDDTINTPSVIQSGEVRMEVGVALEYPAEFVVIRITQFDRGTFTTEVQPIA